MRNPDRLDGFYDAVKALHKDKIPDWRFGQFMYNFISWLQNQKGIDGFYLEEDRYLALLREYLP